MEYLDSIEISEKDPFEVLEENQNPIELPTKDLETQILVHTNEIISPISLNHNIELPLLELYIDKENFVVFTTQNIYNCRDAALSAINYDDIVAINENSLTSRPLNPKKGRIFDIIIILPNGSSVPIKVEYGIPLPCIAHFLTTIIKN